MLKKALFKRIFEEINSSIFFSFIYNSGRKWYTVVESGGLAMFMGEFRHSIDAKCRLIMPAKFRDELKENFIITRGLDGCLTVYTQEQWQVVFEQLKKLPNTKRETRMYIHMLTSKAVECNPDNQGRVLLPQTLLNEAKIEKECVIVGVADHVEIWASDRWDAYYDQASSSFEDIAEQLTDFLA